ncbi:hypothetical protein JN06_00420 [Bacteroides zoogleoformans]|uniref:mRNA interferase MazF n=1 Tax=Bacteroides zoogleoformans TaxID=28119 RepID=A0ABM6T8N2_9BACE|nr:hypothetical protein [Bacteroides zoogleoformans]AVM53216.1 hypothetical protein C4H11_09995 [Bacteroides zoogleoformans]TWJ17848.1 hypothetical protein JN06_00420 [Bacteroides zoogleoformans]
MIKLGNLLGDIGDRLTQDSVKIGNVYLLNLDEVNGITPKDRDSTRNKFFIVLGFDNDGNVIGGLVINSNINYNLPSTVTDYQLPITVDQCPFLKHNSFVNCSKIIVANKTKFTKESYRGEISDSELMGVIVNTVKESPTISRKQLETFGIK